MKTVNLILVILIFPLMNIFGQERDRQPVVSGSFYPSGSERLKNELEGYFSSFAKPSPGVRVRAVLVPHAGYVFSGHTAAAGFAAIPAGEKYENIFLLGVSHRYAFEGAAVFTSGNMVTPLGTLKVNRELGNQLKSTNKWFIEKDEAHGPEHSLEVELPFIQYRFNPAPPIVPILIGTRNLNVLKGIASGLQPWFNERNLFIISSDFSHYPSSADARRVDKMTSDAIIKGDPEGFLRTVRNIESSGVDNLATAMCGWPAGLVLLYMAEKSDGLVFRNVEYTNSGDSPHGSDDEVVGYNAIVLEQRVSAKKERSAAQAFTLTSAEKQVLLSIAREAISARLERRQPAPVDQFRLTPRLREPLGAFVTLTNKGDLRGCIGRFTSSDPLWEVVGAMATEAAFSDPRFPPLSKEEYSSVDIEISVLGPMNKIQSVNEIKIGRHGIYLKKGYRSGTLLPQVAVERGWSVEQFLGYCARDKAGIGWDGWKDRGTEIYVYEAYVFGE
ncbi:MAG: AmmeMemoRadiSam system protein B [Bacteroidales bacterium]|nr:AmmeMemoRadiSam system protein B [Bacteroidales bacterium]